MMRFSWTVLFAAFLIAACETTTLALPDDGEIRASDDQVVDRQEIIVISPSWAAAKSLVRKSMPLGYRLKSEDELDGLNLVMLTMLIPKGQNGGAAIRELERLEAGLTAGVNHAYTPQSEMETSRARYASALMDWNNLGCEARSKVGVLDTGADASFLAEHRVPNADFSRVQGASEGTAHGTAILELFLSSGMLNGLTVYHADVVSVSGALGEVASVDSMLKGLNWLIEKDVKLINISLAGPYNKILDRAFQRAAQEGAIIVAAAGNAGPANKVQYPAAFESTLAVTAVDADAKVYTEAVQGKSIDFSAPGVDVFIGDGKSGQYLSGTSVAAPFVTLRIAGDPSMAQARSVASVRGALSKDVQDLGEAGHDITFGFGLIMAPMPCRNIETAQHE